MIRHSEFVRDQKNGKSSVSQYLRFHRHKKLWLQTELFHNIIIIFGVFRKLVKLIKTYLNLTYSKIIIGKCLPDCKNWGFLGGDYVECPLLRCGAV